MVSFIVGAISIGMAFLYGCVGEILTEKVGHLNLGIPGIISIGAVGGCVGVDLYMKSVAENGNPVFILLLLYVLFFSFLFGALLGLVYVFFTTTLKANQNVTGLVLTTLGVGLTDFLINNLVGRDYLPKAAKILIKSLPFASKLGWFGTIFLDHGVLVYIAIAIALVCSFVLNKTRIGLNIRAVGENPATADAAGINVTLYKYVCTLIGSGIAGIGGAFFIIDYLKGMWEYSMDIIGWLAIALVIFTLWRPALSILGSILFGGLYILAYTVSGISFAQMKLLNIIPYVVTVLVLIVTSIADSKETQPPASLGLNYFREER